MGEVDLTPEERMAFERLPRASEPSRMLEERIVKSLREEGLLARSTSSGAGCGSAVQVGDGGRERGKSRGGGVATGGWARSAGIPPWALAASVAASLVLFGCGVLLGHTVGARSTAETFLAVREQDANQLALRIQEAGSAYVAALAALSELRPAGGLGSGGARGIGGAGDTSQDRSGQAGQGELTGRGGEQVRGPASNAGLAQVGLGLAQGREVAMGTLYGAAYELARLDPGNTDVLQILQILEDRRARAAGHEGGGRDVIWF